MRYTFKIIDWAGIVIAAGQLYYTRASAESAARVALSRNPYGIRYTVSEV